MDDPSEAWLPATSVPSLAGDEVHVWAVPLDAETARLETLLSPDERVRAARYRYPDLRREFTAGRGALRKLVGGYLGIEPDRLGFVYEERGRPVLSSEFSGAGLNFNLSNARDLALVAVTRGRGVGVDLEVGAPRGQPGPGGAPFLCPCGVPGAFQPAREPTAGRLSQLLDAQGGLSQRARRRPFPRAGPF